MDGTVPALSQCAARKVVLPPLAPVSAESAVVSQSDRGLATPGDSEEDANKVVTSPARASFRSAGQVVKVALRVSQGFATLRDMVGMEEVRACDLKPVRKLGEGAFAVVEECQYTPGTCGGGGGDGGTERASSPGASRRVAVKRLKPEIMKQQADLESFIKEAALMRKLSHKRVVEFIGVGSTDTSSEDSRRRTMFLVQEYMDGGTLKKVVSRQMIDVSRQLYTYQDAFRWALNIAEGLEYLHGAKPMVIHRDLKLENILLKGTDLHSADAKIADFGLVALVRPRQRGLHEALQEADANQLQRKLSTTPSGFRRMMSMQKKSQAAHKVQDLWDQSFKLAQAASGVSYAPLHQQQQLSGRTGSYMYMAPEMYKEQEYSEKVDVFSFGVIIFEVFARYQTVCAISLEGTEAEIESYAAKVADGYRPPIPDNWPQGVRELIARCWHQDPEQRPPMSWVRQRLVQMAAEGVPDEMQAKLRPPACACVIM